MFGDGAQTQMGSLLIPYGVYSNKVNFDFYPIWIPLAIGGLLVMKVKVR